MKRMLSTLLALCLLLTLTPAALGAQTPMGQDGIWIWTWEESTGLHTFTLGGTTIQDADFMAAVDKVAADEAAQSRPLIVKLSGDAAITDPPREDGGQSTIKVFEGDGLVFDLDGNTLTLSNMHLGAGTGAAMAFENGSILFTDPAGENAPAVPVLSARNSGSLTLENVTVARTDGGVVVSTIVSKGKPGGACLQIVDSTLRSTAEDMGDGQGLNAMIVAADTTATMENSTLTGASTKYPAVSVTGGTLTLDGGSTVTATASGVAAAIVRNGELYLNGGTLAPGAGAYACGGRTNGTLRLSGDAALSSAELRSGDRIVDDGFTGGPVALTCTGGQTVGDLLVTGCTSEAAAQKFQPSAQNTVGLSCMEAENGRWTVVAAAAEEKADTYTMTQDQHDRYTVTGTYKDGGTYVVIQEEPSFQAAIYALFGDVQGTGATIQLGDDLTIVGTTENLPEYAYPTTGVGEGWITWDLRNHTLHLDNLCMIAQIDGALTVKNGAVAFTGGKIHPDAALFGAQDNGKVILENVTATRDDGGCLLGAYGPNEKEGASVTATGCTLSNGDTQAQTAEDFGTNAIYACAKTAVALKRSTVTSAGDWAGANITGGTLELDAGSTITAAEGRAAVGAENGTVRVQGAALTGTPALRDWGGAAFFLSENARAATIEVAGPGVVDAAGYTGADVALTYTGADVLVGVPLVTGCADETTARKFTVAQGAANAGYRQQEDGTWAAVAAATPLAQEAADLTGGTVYSISSKEEMERLAELVNGGTSGAGCFFVLTGDIDLAGGQDDPWMPVGSERHAFAGTFDGAGHTVRGLYINAPEAVTQGLFGCVGAAGTVRALTVAGQITADGDAGGVVGENYGLVELCVGEITLTGRKTMGGIVGWNYYTYPDNTKGRVRACVNKGDVSAAEGMAGGIAGSNYGEITDSVNTGAVSGGSSSTRVGGIAGDSRGGGIVRCMSLGQVSGHSDVGGIVGISDRASTVSDCVALGLAVRADSNAGRITGAQTDGLLGRSFARADLSLTGGAVTEETAAQTGRDGESLSLTGDWQKTAFAGWDFENTWNAGTGDSLPTLQALKAMSLTVSHHPSSGGGTVTPPAPRPDIPSTDHGTATVSPQRPEPGTGVTVTPRPNDGYVVDRVIVTGQGGREIPVKDNGDGTYSYTQPREKVTVTVTFKPRDNPLPFTDVTENDWFYDSVNYVYGKDLMRGTSDTTFSPCLSTSRSMIVTILWRLEGAPAAASAALFTDVPPSQYYTSAVAWGAENGIIKGYGSCSFGPNDPITREQLTAILYRYAQFKGMDTPTEGMAIGNYADSAQVSPWARDAMRWALGMGIITGTDGGVLDPLGKATRAETAAILMRFILNICP